MTEVTFREFYNLMAIRKRTVDDLVDLFRGKLDDNRAFFERVMSCQWRNPETGRYEYRGNVVIPYRSVIEFYQQELHFLKEGKREEQERRQKRPPRTEKQKEQALQALALAKAKKKSVTIEN